MVGTSYRRTSWLYTSLPRSISVSVLLSNETPGAGTACNYTIVLPPGLHNVIATADIFSLFQIVGDYRHRTILGADEGTHLNGGLVSLLYWLAIDDTSTEGASE